MYKLRAYVEVLVHILMENITSPGYVVKTIPTAEAFLVPISLPEIPYIFKVLYSPRVLN
jgi:hypothetical protein